MPALWKYGMVVLVVCLLASMAIAIYRLTTTPTEIFGGGFRGLTHASGAPYVPHRHIRRTGTRGGGGMSR